MQRTAEDVATLIALLFRRAGVKRARVSEKTVRYLSNRSHLRTIFVDKLRQALDELDLHIVELNRGGFGLVPISALDGAEPILAKEYLSEDLKKLRQEKKKIDDFRAELHSGDDFENENE